MVKTPPKAPRKKLPIDGWLVIDKPANMTSNTVVNKVKWAMSAAKAGHSGTLDPTATGILPIALGEATKTIPFVMDALKTYRFTLRLGVATNTDDTEGEVTVTSEIRPDDAAIRAGLTAFEGDIMQRPPQFSAVKIDGQRAYHLARAGVDFTVQERPLWVESLAMISRPDADHVVLEMVCGKGGYVRSIARDLGEMLGCFAHVAGLRRTETAGFNESHAVDWDAVLNEDLGALSARLLPIEAGLHSLPCVVCPMDAASSLYQGNPAPVIFCEAEEGAQAWARCGERPIAIGVYSNGMVHPNRVLLPSKR